MEFRKGKRNFTQDIHSSARWMYLGIDPRFGKDRAAFKAISRMWSDHLV
jgi:hypothetical protein